MTRNQNHGTENSIIALIDRLNAGIELPGGLLYAKSIKKGGLKEERTLDLYLRQYDDENRILRATLFTGRAEFFKPWIDLSHIQNRLILNRKTLVYLDSDIEMTVYRLLIDSMSTGGKIFVEYEDDPETRIGLYTGVPVPATRIGHLLYLNGITGFNGFSRAGEIKKGKKILQGVKAISSSTRQRHMGAIASQLECFLECTPCTPSHTEDPILGRALKRAQAILEAIVPQKMAS